MRQKMRPQRGRASGSLCLPPTPKVTPAAGGALPGIDRKDVITRAWAIFRRTYKFPTIKYSDIGRACFGWALRRAWIEARTAAERAALSAASKAERIEVLETRIARAGYIDNGRSGRPPLPPAVKKSGSCGHEGTDPLFDAR